MNIFGSMNILLIFFPTNLDCFWEAFQCVLASFFKVKVLVKVQNGIFFVCGLKC